MNSIIDSDFTSDMLEVLYMLNYFQRPLALKILLVPPKVSFTVGFCGKVGRGYACQNLCK